MIIFLYTYTAAGLLLRGIGKISNFLKPEKNIAERICLIYRACSTTTPVKNDAEKDICSQSIFTGRKILDS